MFRSTLEHSANVLAELLDMKFPHEQGQWHGKVANRKKEALRMVEEAHEEVRVEKIKNKKICNKNKYFILKISLYYFIRKKCLI